MDLGGLVYDLVRLYVLGLVLAAALTVAWLFRGDVGSQPGVAGIWFAVGGFGVLVLGTFLLVQFSRG
ncbi:MAG: hypothetical protein ABEJ76_04770 [Halanaeroarchaeum sp.]